MSDERDPVTDLHEVQSFLSGLEDADTQVFSDEFESVREAAELRIAQSRIDVAGWVEKAQAELPQLEQAQQLGLIDASVIDEAKQRIGTALDLLGFDAVETTPTPVVEEKEADDQPEIIFQFGMVSAGRIASFLHIHSDVLKKNNIPEVDSTLVDELLEHAPSGDAQKAQEIRRLAYTKLVELLSDDERLQYTLEGLEEDDPLKRFFDYVLNLSPEQANFITDLVNSELSMRIDHISARRWHDIRRIIYEVRGADGSLIFSNTHDRTRQIYGDDVITDGKPLTEQELTDQFELRSKVMEVIEPAFARLLQYGHLEGLRPGSICRILQLQQEQIDDALANKVVPKSPQNGAREYDLVEVLCICVFANMGSFYKEKARGIKAVVEQFVKTQTA